jgi:hypothetical protein
MKELAIKWQFRGWFDFSTKFENCGYMPKLGVVVTFYSVITFHELFIFETASLCRTGDLLFLQVNYRCSLYVSFVQR